VAAPLRGAQWDALAAFAADPALAPHVAKEVAAAGPGYIAAAFSLLPPGRRDGAALAAMLGAALRTPRHVFLARLAGRRVGKAEARILSKLDDVVERRAALALIRLAKGEAAPRLRHMPRLRAAAASLLPTLPRAVAAAAAPVVLASPPTGFEEDIRDSLRLLVRRLQRSAPEQIATLCGEIGRAPSLEALNRVAERWVAQTSPVPVRVPHPVPGTRRLVPLTTRAALADAGRRFRNCLRRTTPDDPVYEWRGRRPALVSLVRDANGLWAIGQIAGPENGDVPHRTRQRIAAPLYRQLAGRLAHTKKPR
jgi:hypothetical protein